MAKNLLVGASRKNTTYLIENVESMGKKGMKVDDNLEIELLREM